MRLTNMQNIWIQDGTKWHAGNFIAYKGNGLAKIVSGHHGISLVPLNCIKPRTKPLHSFEGDK